MTNVPHLTAASALLEASPDAVVVVSVDGTVVWVNELAGTLFGHAAADLVGQPVEVLLPASLRDRHTQHRARFLAAPTRRPMGAAEDLLARRRDGSSIPVDIALLPMRTDEGPAVAAFVRDATARRDAARHRQQLRETQLARRQAFELNDSIVQQLTAATWHLETGRVDEGLRAVRETLESARQMMTDLLGHDAAVAPGSLVREQPAGMAGPLIPPSAPRTELSALRVVVADDAQEVRMLMRLRLSSRGVEVVAEAVDGQEAVEQVDAHLPDAILLDLSMPRMDGLQAAQVLRERHPGLRIVVVSGHSAQSMEEAARHAGADAYVEKGADFEDVLRAVRGPLVA